MAVYVPQPKIQGKIWRLLPEPARPQCGHSRCSSASERLDASSWRSYSHRRFGCTAAVAWTASHTPFPCLRTVSLSSGARHAWGRGLRLSSVTLFTGICMTKHVFTVLRTTFRRKFALCIITTSLGKFERFVGFSFRRKEVIWAIRILVVPLLPSKQGP